MTTTVTGAVSVTGSARHLLAYTIPAAVRDQIERAMCDFGWIKPLERAALERMGFAAQSGTSSPGGSEEYQPGVTICGI